MRTPIVVIVGRPNVGKSTLFNRLTKSDSAIVDDVSGVTRDRLYGEADWNGKMFKVIDTGGYVPESKDLFEKAIREQVEIALEEADSILFVVDGKLGLSPVDEDIARILLTSSKPSYLLVNKLDTPQKESEKAEFYSLGLEKVFDVSAINGRNLGDMLDDMIDNLDFQEGEAEQKEAMRLAILGRPNVGKSSLVNSLLGYDRSIVTDIPGTTRDSINSTLKYYGEEIILVDTAGLRKKTRVKENIEFFSNVRTLRALGDCDTAIIMIDANIGLERQDQKIIEEAYRRRKGIILAVNKWDIIEKDSKTSIQFERNIRSILSYLEFVPIIFISALTKQRIFKLLELAKKVHEERKKKISTSYLNDLLLPEIDKNPPPASPIGKEVKIKYATQVGRHYPVFLFFCNHSKHIPDHYKKFLERLIRKQFGFEGVPMTISFRDK
jgi:GTP-binding protein